MEECIFCKIRDGKIPTNFLYQDEKVMVFPDIHPVKPIHLLIIPKEHVAEFVAVENMDLFQDISQVIQKMICEQKLDTKGYQIRINGGGAQDVDHLHIHLLGPMGKSV